MGSVKKFSSCGNLRSLSKTFSTNYSDRPTRITFQYTEQETDPSPTSASKAALLNSPEFPLPGDVTTQYQYQKNVLKQAVSTTSCLQATDVLTGLSNHQKQMHSLKNFALSANAIPPSALEPMGLTAPPSSMMNKEAVQLSAHDCPELVKKDFRDLFPNVNLSRSPLTVVNMARRTSNDMGAWTENMEIERDTLTEEFVREASSICDSLREAGYWADFIDPSSGRPYLGPFTNATLFETDGRLSKFGFDVEDLGCCKVINHKQWGRHAFIGTLFTTAPLGSDQVQKLLGSK